MMTAGSDRGSDVDTETGEMSITSSPDVDELATQAGPSKDERLDFLKQAIAFTEWTIRSFDTKAQISIAAFVLSMTPLWSILTSACPRAASSPLVAVLLVLLVVTILLYRYVLSPHASRPC